MKNPFLNLNWADFGKGLLILVVSTMLASLEPLFKTGWPTWLQFEPILQTTVAAVLVYIVKNMFTNVNQENRSPLYQLNFTDIMWGIVIAVGSFVLSSIVDILQTGWPTWETLKPIMSGAVSAGISYIVKNLFTSTNNQLLKK